MNQKIFLTLKSGLDNTGSKCFLCDRDLGHEFIAVDIDSHIQMAFHPGCDEIAFKLFGVFFRKELQYYLETGIKDLFKEEGN